MPESTGFKCYYDELFVGDLLSIYSGYDGFVRVTKKEGRFWLVYDGDASESFASEPIELKGDIGAPYRKVDPNDRYREPPFPIVCDQCKETIIGYFDMEDGNLSWNDDCGEHYVEKVKRPIKFLDIEIEDTEFGGKCKACAADPNRMSETRRLYEYRLKKEKETGLRTVHYPSFKTTEEIDKFFEDLSVIMKEL